jgi:hypothetical protein
MAYSLACSLPKPSTPQETLSDGILIAPDALHAAFDDVKHFCAQEIESSAITRFLSVYTRI